MKKESKTLAVFKNKEFIKLWIGQIFSYLGDAIVQIALMAWVISLGGHSGSEMSKILFFFILPSLLLSPLAGALSDRFSRKTLMVLSNLFRACLVFIIPVLLFSKSSTHLHTMVYAFSFLIGSGSAFFFPAKQSALPNLVKSEHLQFANALNAGTSTIAILLGAVITGLYISKFGLDKSLWVNGFVYLTSAVIISLISFNNSSVASKVTPKTDISTGIKFVFNYLKTHKNTRRLIILSILLTLVTASFFNTLTSVSTDYYHIDIAGLSKLKAMLGVGMILGTFVVGFAGKYARTSTILACSFIAVFLTTATAQMVTTYYLAWIWLVLIGIANASMVITIDTILQKATPDRIRGKIFGLKSTLTSLVFLATTWGVSELVLTTSPFKIFKFVSLTSLLIALAVVLFDNKFRHFTVSTFIGAIFRILFPVKIEGREYLVQNGKMILAGNHTGWVDTLILQTACKRPVWYITGPVAFQLPVVKHIIKYFNVIPIVPRKGREGLDAAINKIEKGEVVCIFPEGRLTEDGNLMKFNKGVAYMHKNSKALIVPFVIQGGFEAWAYNKPFPTFRKIVIQFGQPLNMTEAEDKDIVNELKNRVQFIKDSLERREKALNKNYYENVLDLMQLKSDANAPVKALSLKDKGKWTELSYIELSRQAKNFGNFLIAGGIERGDRIAILSESRPEWGIALFASFQTGAITVPLDVKLTISELTSILSDCQPKLLCVSTHYLETAKEIKSLVPSIEAIYIIDDVKDQEFPTVYEVKGPEGDMGRERSLDETALIVYTSGTTGNPKGVMITFGNIISQLKDFEALFKIDSSDSLISILPLNHLLELNVGFMGMLHMGAMVSYSTSLNPKEISKIMKERQATYMIVVPLFIKMLKNSVEKEIRKSSKQAQSTFNFMYNVAKYLPIRRRRLMFKQIIDGFGGKMKGFVSGGAPLDADVAEFFERMGMPIYQGYGLTETSPTITTNTPKYNRIGSVGKPLPSVMVKISAEGEILAKGGNLMKGYYNKSEMTREVIDEEGWFHTGDIGEFDKDGFLYITGRIKNMIVLGGGKKIFPEEVEAVLEKSPIVKELCVMSVKIQGGSKDGTEEVCSVIVPSDELVKKYKDDFAGLEKEISSEINQLAKAGLASYKCPTVIAVSLEELPKTATRKVKRKDVQAWYYERYSRV
ncbi:MAG: hypothetical protein A2039_08470 [Candidatus Melainabacteria bacterium GWA2_34_9]|nr:MAG: hypothetical protein A2039_08470 [Candidatus Melainabacteria bacterium GWA2_34_9]